MSVGLAYYQKFAGINEPASPGYYWVKYRAFKTHPFLVEIVRLDWLQDPGAGLIGLRAGYAGGGPMWMKEFSQYEPALWGPRIPCPWSET